MILFRRKTHTALAGMLLCVSTQSIWCQGLGALVAGNGKSAQPAEHPDPLKRTTPRDAIYAFLQACHDDRLDLAAQYLDLRRLRSDRRASQGPELAKELCDSLDRDVHFEVGRLSNRPEGDPADGLAANVDRLNAFDVNGQTLTLTLERTTVGDSHAWLVSSDSALLISRVASLNSESPLEKRLPEPLVHIRFVGTPLYIWIELILAALILSLLSRLLSRVFLFILNHVAARFRKQLHEHRLESLVEPLRLVISVIVFGVVVQTVGPSALSRDYLFKLLTLLFILGVGSILMRGVDIVSDTVTSRLDPRERTLSYSVLPLLVRSIKVIIFGAAVLSVLSAWGYNTNTILAGLGVGGLAVALAAQKTIENLFGGVAVITDRPVLVGDFCRFGDQVGTVEDIGLRSTRIRTLDRTVVTIPNSVFSTMTLENFAKRDRMWFHPTIQLGRRNTPEKIQAMIAAITKVLEDHPMVDPTTVPLRFTKITKDSFDLEVFSYVLTSSYDEFLKVQTELLLSITKAAQELNVDFAVPLQETILPPDKIMYGNKPPAPAEQRAQRLDG